MIFIFIHIKFKTRVKNSKSKQWCNDAFTFTFASREFPRTCGCCIVCDSINRPGDLDLWPFYL